MREIVRTDSLGARPDVANGGPEERRWQEQANCLGVDPDLFFPERGASTKEAKATPGFRLPARWIIHAVGPVWHGGDAGEPDHLASAYRRSLAVADELGARSVAFPAISTGIYGYPLDAATAIAVHTCRDAETDVNVIRFVAFDDRTFATYRDALAG